MCLAIVTSRSSRPGKVWKKVNKMLVVKTSRSNFSVTVEQIISTTKAKLQMLSYEVSITQFQPENKKNRLVIRLESVDKCYRSIKIITKIIFNLMACNSETPQYCAWRQKYNLHWSKLSHFWKSKSHNNFIKMISGFKHYFPQVPCESAFILSKIRLHFTFGWVGVFPMTR